MKDHHITSSVIEALHRGELPSGLREAISLHLTICRRCRQRLWGRVSDEGTNDTSNRKVIPESAYTQALDAVFDRLSHEYESIEENRSTALTLFDELAGLSPSQQRLLIRNSARYHVWPLALELLAACQDGWTEDPRRSETLAHAAIEVADCMSVTGFRGKLLNDLRAEAWSYVGNCRRISSDLAGAQEAFGHAKKYLEEGSGDLLDRARLADLESSLLRAQRNFQGATRLLAEAIGIYRSVGDGHLEGRALLKQAKLLADSGHVAEPVPLLERAADLIDLEREPRLMLLLKWSLASHLIKADRLEEAQTVLPQVRDLVRSYGKRQDRLRVLWVEGELRGRLGQFELAEEMLKRVREGFVIEGITYDVALVSLDLAILYLEADRTKEARKVAIESIPLFTSRGVHREALMAWNLFREAAERDALTLGLVQEVASRIRQSQSRPAAGGDPA